MFSGEEGDGEEKIHSRQKEKLGKGIEVWMNTADIDTHWQDCFHSMREYGTMEGNDAWMGQERADDERPYLS